MAWSSRAARDGASQPTDHSRVRPREPLIAVQREEQHHARASIADRRRLGGRATGRNLSRSRKLFASRSPPTPATAERGGEPRRSPARGRPRRPPDEAGAPPTRRPASGTAARALSSVGTVSFHSRSTKPSRSPGRRDCCSSTGVRDGGLPIADRAPLAGAARHADAAPCRFSSSPGRFTWSGARPPAIRQVLSPTATPSSSGRRTSRSSSA
jgi:hypothetical protein